MWDEQTRAAVEPEVREAVNNVADAGERGLAIAGEHSELDLGGARKITAADRELAVALNVILEFIVRDFFDPNAPDDWKPGLDEARHLITSELVYYDLPIVAPSLPP